MKTRTCLFLVIAAVMIVTPGRRFALTQPLPEDGTYVIWGTVSGAGGSLSGITRDNHIATVCATLGTPTYPVLHPTPKNPDGTAANCTRKSFEIFAAGGVFVPGAMSGGGNARFHWGFTGELISVPSLEAKATVDSVETGCDLPNQPCLAEVDSSVSFYAENIDCQCLPGAQVSINLGVNAFGQAPSQSAVTVITASEVDRQTDSFTGNSFSENKSTTPLRIGGSKKFSVLITVGAVQQEQGSIEGDAYDRSNLGFEISYKEFDPPGSTGTTPRADSDPTLDPSTGFNALTPPRAARPKASRFSPTARSKRPSSIPTTTCSTAPLGINNAGTIVGQYENASGGINTYHGFMLAPGGAFSTYDIGIPNVSTSNGDFGGDFGSNSQITQGFLNSGGKVVTFGVPGLNTYPQAMNDSDTIVGVYLDANQNYQSFQRTTDGTLSTFNFPGAVSTHAEGINNAGTINGYFTDSAGKTHGFFGPLGLFVPYDLTGTAGTFGRGINNAGAVTGSLADSSGVLHGFSAQLCAADVSSRSQ